MKRSLTLVFALFALLATPAMAADVYVAHGINGTDLGLSEELSVDVFVSGVGCALTGFEFRTITDAIELPTGKYDIEVRVSDGSCTGALAASTTVDLAIGENATIIAHLNEEGSPTLTKYTNDVRASSDDNARLAIRHAAAAPPVVVTLNKRFRLAARWELDNPGGRQAELKAGSYQARINDDTSGLFGSRLAGPIPVDLPVDTLVTVYAVGSLKNGTFELLPQVIALP